MQIQVYGVNAFTADGEGGNPAGVVLEASALSDEQMQAIATEIGASETAFVLPDSSSTHKFRFFTPTTEIELCGHATIATWWLMCQRSLHSSGNYTQNNLAGVVNISIDDNGLVFMEQPPQKLRNYVDQVRIAEALNTAESDIDLTLKPQIVQQQLMIGLKSEDMLHNLKPNLSEIEKISIEHDFYGFHVYVLLDNQESIATVRNFCPRVGINEDAATGTGNGSFLEYFRVNNMLSGRDVYRIEQGKAMGRRSYVYGKFHDGRVWIGGNARPVEERTINL